MTADDVWYRNWYLLYGRNHVKPRAQNRILVPLGGSQGIKVFRGAPPSFLCPPPHPGVHVAIFTHFGKRQISIHSWYSGRLSRNPHFRSNLNWNHQTKSSTYSTNVMALIRTGQQNDVVLEKRSNSRNFVRKKSRQRSAIDEEAVVVLWSCCLRFTMTDDCWNNPRKIMYSMWFLRGYVPYWLGDSKRTIHL